MAISTLDELVAGLTIGERAHFFRFNVLQTAAGQWASMWRIAGMPGAAAAAPGAVAVADNTTSGAMKFTNPAAGKSKYLAQLGAASSQRGTVVLVDRLVHMSGLNGTLTTAQAVSTPALPSRDANGAQSGADVEAWLEVYTAIGATARVATVSYTNQAGTAARTGTATIGGTNLTQAGRMVQVQLQAGDTGVRSVESVTLAGTTGTAGDFGVTLLRRLGQIDIPNANTSYSKDFADLGMPPVFSGSCLFLMGIFDTTTSANIYGEYALAEG